MFSSLQSLKRYTSNRYPLLFNSLYKTEVAWMEITYCDHTAQKCFILQMSKWFLNQDAFTGHTKWYKIYYFVFCENDLNEVNLSLKQI